MAIIRGLKTGWHNSTSAIGTWSVPQEIGDDRPRGNRAYNSFDMTKGLSFNGVFKAEEGLNIVDNKLTAGRAIIWGHLFELEEDIELGGIDSRIILGIDRNETERNVYISVKDTTGSEPEETLTPDSGVYEIELWKKELGNWVFKLPASNCINNYLQPKLIQTNGKNIYDIELTSFSQTLIDNPSDYNWDNTTLTLMIRDIGEETNSSWIRIRKSNSFLELEFDEDVPEFGINTISVYTNEEGKLKATIGVRK